MSFSRILAALPLLLSATGLLSTVDARWASKNDNQYAGSGAAVPIPANWTVPLSPNSVSNETIAGLPPPPGVSKFAQAQASMPWLSMMVVVDSLPYRVASATR